MTASPRRPAMAGSCLAALLALLAIAPASAAAQDADLARQVEIRRTAYGVPHVRAENLRAAGYGLGWIQMEDYGQVVVHGLVRNRGELGLHFGRDSVDVDFRTRPVRLKAAEKYPLLDADVREVYEGFAAAVNRFITLHPQRFPTWVEPDFTGPDLLTTDMEWPDPSSTRGILRRIGALPPDSVGRNPDEGSNAWAFAPSRTKSGKAILLRNPHLNWDAGYYEAHLIVPGILDFYGDYRIGGPFQTIGGFNRRLGWSTTNNAPDPDEVYAIPADSAHPGNYIFDGASLPIRRIPLTIRYRSGDTIASMTRETLTTQLGPVIHQANGKVYVWKAAGMEEYRLAEQWLGMMRARNIEEWKQAMRILAKPSSNFTYADADGNIFYVWFGHQPRIPHAPGGDSIAIPAKDSSQVWTRIVPFDSLPQLLNPKGGYIHQENDPFHYTNLNEVLRPERFPANFPRPNLGLRSQHALQLVTAEPKMSLEDVVRLKNSMRMLLADRVKDELIAAVRRAADPSPRIEPALDVLEAWDNTVARDSRGGVLFETWWNRYVQTARTSARADRMTSVWREPWSADAPTTTPRGLADPERAAAAFSWAVNETTRRYGSPDVAWGDVHRVRIGDVDEPVGGCAGGLGCFRVLWYEQDPDGKLRAAGGDGWVLAVEFGDPPRAYSILAYGESANDESPHHADQAAMFAREEMKRVAYTEEEIEAQTVRRYRPGVEEQTR